MEKNVFHKPVKNNKVTMKILEKLQLVKEMTTQLVVY